MIFLILCKTEFKFFIKIVFICRSYHKFQIYRSSFNLIQCEPGIFYHNIVILDFVCTHGIKFSDRNLIQSSVFNRQFSWKTHLCEPSRVIASICKRIPVLHPGDHNSSSIRRKQCLHCVIVNSVINTLTKLFL